MGGGLESRPLLTLLAIADSSGVRRHTELFLSLEEQASR
jgi:hypothetical protein